MAYDEGLAQRVREHLADDGEVREQKMFGGIGFLRRGHMVCGIGGDGLMARVGVEGYDEALAQPHVEPFGPAGRPMTGWVLVTAPGIADDAALARWIERGRAVAASLPPK